MAFFDSIRHQLEDAEGRETHPYKCSTGHLTIGVGRNLETVGLKPHEIDYLFANDVNEAILDLESIFGPIFANISPNRRLALIDMRFNLGYGGFRQFKKMVHAIREGDWNEAAKQAVDSVWATQVQKTRVDRVEKQLRKG